MPKKIDITLPSTLTNGLVEEVKTKIEIIGIRVFRNVSIKPEGDQISIELTNTSLISLMRLLEKKGLLSNDNVSLSTSQPVSIVSISSSEQITNDLSEATWEEMLSTINRESEMSINGMITMAIAGILATIGIVTNALHLVIGAMVIAPGFEPIIRVSLGAINKSRQWKKGIYETLKGYSATIIAAIATALILKSMGKEIVGGEVSYLSSGVLVSYWTKFSATSLMVSALGAIAGTIVIIAHRSVLTAGVMIALALIPTISITGIAIVAGDFQLAGQAFSRWGIEVGFIIIFSIIVFLLKKQFVHKGSMQLK